MLTALLREKRHTIQSWVENGYENGYLSTSREDFEKWVNSNKSDNAFEFDTHGAMDCEMFIYIGPAGKDAATECGMCYGQRLAGNNIPMIALFAKGEDFGLMRNMFDGWYDRYPDIIEAVKLIQNN